MTEVNCDADTIATQLRLNRYQIYASQDGTDVGVLTQVQYLKW